MFASFSGVVIRCANSGESDRIITVLCKEYGKISVLAKGARKTGSKFMSSTSLYCYANFSVRKEEKLSFLREAELYNSFFDLRCSLSAMALAGYACAVCDDVVTEDEGELLLPLLLNTLYALSCGKYDERFVKASFEITAACICGFTPDISGCAFCGGGFSNGGYLDVMNGAVICDGCKEKQNEEKEAQNGTASVICPLSASAIAAIKYIVCAEPKRIFSYTLAEQDVGCFVTACEKYLLHHLERSFDSLDFYKSVKD